MPNTREKPMGRLTLPHFSGNGHYMKCSEQFGCSGECADCEELDKIVERLAYYEDMVANGVTVQNWIPVTERLPDFSGDYLICCDTGYITVLPYSVRYKQFNAFDNDSGTKFAIPVTHWMPLPVRPMEE